MGGGGLVGGVFPLKEFLIRFSPLRKGALKEERRLREGGGKDQKKNLGEKADLLAKEKDLKLICVKEEFARGGVKKQDEQTKNRPLLVSVMESPRQRKSCEVTLGKKSEEAKGNTKGGKKPGTGNHVPTSTVMSGTADRKRKRDLGRKKKCRKEDVCGLEVRAVKNSVESFREDGKRGSPKGQKGVDGRAKNVSQG